MPQRVEKIFKSNRKNKKYVAHINDKGQIIKIHFGDKRYQQYKDKIGEYSQKDHKDNKRRKLYYLRHSGVDNKHAAIRKEWKKSNGKYNAKILSHIYLW